MQAALVEKNSVQVREVDTPEPGPSEVLLEVRASAVNHGEVFIKNGQVEVAYPQIPGYDVAGVVTECGRDVSEELSGKRVVVNGIFPCGTCVYCSEDREILCRSPELLGQSRPGGHAEYVSVPADRLVELPDATTFMDAATLPTAFGTAARALLTRSTMGLGDDVLVIGASGGVGHAAVQLALLAGATVSACTSSSRKADKLRELGVDTIIRYDRESIEDEVSERSDRGGVDIVFDSVGGDGYESALRSLRGGGQLVTVGATTGDASPTNLPQIFAKQLEVVGSSRYTNRDLQRLVRLLAAGKISPHVDEVIDLSSIGDAYERLEQRDLFGRIVIDHS